MPTYLYQVIEADGSAGKSFEWTQSLEEAALTEHPLSGKPVRKLILAPTLTIQHSEGATRQRLNHQRIEKAGFTRYERDKLTGQYHKTFGDGGPETIQKQ